MSTVKYDFHVETVRRSKKKIVDGQEEAREESPHRIPRMSKLMALAIYCEQMIQDGVVRDYRELAELGHVSRARISQLMNLNMLAPEIQEAILFLPPVESGKDPVTERELRRVVGVVDWGEQKRQFGRERLLQEREASTEYVEASQF